jgi:predicted acetyltransferase
MITIMVTLTRQEEETMRRLDKLLARKGIVDIEKTLKYCGYLLVDDDSGLTLAEAVNYRDPAQS